jgi:hypothetical protein
MKYRIKNKEFVSKTEITEYCRDLISRNAGNKLFGSDLEFITELLSYHPNKNKLDGIEYIDVSLDKMKKNNCLWIHKQTKSGVKVIDDVSWTKCISNIPFSQDTKIDYIFKFGKYEGKSIYDVKDDDTYIEWFSKIPNLYRGDKILINQFIKYGYIPYNPMFYKKNNKQIKN